MNNGLLDSLTLMFRDFAQKQVPDRDKARELIRLAQAGDVQARNEMIERNMRLVIMVAKQKRRCGVDWEDLIQEGVFGLENAVANFDLGMGTEFSTYAAVAINRCIERYLLVNRSLIKIPHGYRRHFRTDSQMVRYLQVLLRGIKSIDATSVAGRHAQRSTKLADTLPDRTQRSVEVWLDRKAAYAALHDKLDRLDARNQRILWCRACGMSLVTLAATEGLTKERIRQLEARGLNELAQLYGKEKAACSLAQVP
jgi:RNA polymerase sigma factor (sigma-70 family)